MNVHPFKAKLGSIALGVCLALVACGKASDSESDRGGGGSSASSAGKGGEAGAPVQLGVGGDVQAEPPMFAGAGGLPAQPVVACGQAGAEEAGSGPDEPCSLPPSVCAGLGRLVFYSDGECVAGMCRWTAATLQCPERCSNGACASSTTEK